MPLNVKGLDEEKKRLKRFTPKLIASLAQQAVGEPTRVLFPPYKFPPTKSENPKAPSIVKKFEDLVVKALGS